MEEVPPVLNIESDDIEQNIYNISLLKGDKVLVILKEDGNLNDYISVVEDFIVINDKKYISIKTEYENIYNLETDPDDFILKEQSKHKIIDIEKIIEFDLDELDDVVNINLTKDIYPEILLDIKERPKKDYIYTKTDKKESLISELISSMDIYDNEMLIKKISIMANTIFDMINKDLTLNEYEKILNTNKFPDWLIPISNNLKRYYPDNSDNNLDINYENIIIKKELKSEIKSQFIHLITKDKDKQDDAELEFTYQQIINNLYANIYNPIQEYEFTDGYLLNNYNGEYYLDCFDNNCIGQNGFYNVDNRKTRNELIYNTNINDKYEKIILIQKENINLSGFFIIPNKYNYFNYNIHLDNDLFTLGEKIILNNFKYTIDSNNNIINKLITDIQVDKYNIDKNLEDYDINYNNFNIFSLDDKFTKDELLTIFDKYLPSQIDILKVINKYILNYIFNYTDFIKLFIKYNINLENIDNRLKNSLNTLITTNVNRYKDIYNTFKLNKESIKISKKLTISEKIYFIKNYIYNQQVIPTKNIYIKKLIEKYSREAKGDTENNNYLYNKHNNEKLLCKHHLFSSNIKEDNTAYESLINNFGTSVIDGCVYCKHCNEFLDFEKFSLYQGFDEENKPIKMTALSEEIEEELFKNISNEDKKTKELIELLSKKINIYLTDIDKKEIINLYNVINNEILANNRYEMINISTQNHPIIKNNINNKNLKILKIYLIYSNKLLFLFTVILIYFQTAIPEYITRSNINLNIIDLTSNKYKFIKEESNSNIINIKTVDYLINRIKVLTNKYRKDQFWKNIKIFLDEQKDVNIPGPREQIINTVKHILSSQYNNILERIKQYREFKLLSNKKFIINYWSSYRPLPTNNNIQKINELVIKNINDIKNKNIHIKKYDGTLYLENISLIKELNKINYKDLYIDLNISISNIQNNTSFNKFVNYVNDLYGVHPENNYFNNLISYFIDTINDKEILTLFEKYKWNNTNKNFRNKNIYFNELKKLINEIYDYYNSKNIDKTSLFLYNYNIQNNINCILLNSKPKRVYKNNYTELFSNEHYESMNNKKSIDKIFDKYCYDSNNNLIIDDKTDNIVSDFLQINTKLNICNHKETPNNKNFIKILNDIIKKNKLEYYDTNINLLENENMYKVDNLITFINSNKVLLNDENIQNILNYSLNYLNDNIDNSELYKQSITNIFDTIIQKTNKINNFINTTPYIESTRKQNINSRTGPYNIRLNKINMLLLNIVKNGYIETIKKYINIVRYTISKINNYKNLSIYSKLTQNVFHKIVPNNWNLSDTNKEKLELFLTDKEFLLHNLIYIEKNNKKIDNGFYEYLQDNDISNLQDIVNSYTTNIDIINSTNNTYLDETTAKMILGYSLISILSDIIDYCDILSTDNNVTVITNILLDIILNIIQDYNDKRWINSIDLESINLNLSKQKEREKQNLLTKLDQMDKDERFAKVQLQTVGATNWFRMGEKEGAEYLDSHAYTDELEFERNKHLENVYNSPNEIINDIYTDTPDNSNNPIDNLQQDIDDGYNNINSSNYDDSEEHDSHEY
tara:strand:+ start:560 stop:5218 length:4659 start_codon:yes stop_codon:yes gene_type:complete